LTGVCRCAHKLSFGYLLGLLHVRLTGSDDEAAGQQRWSSMSGVGVCCRSGTEMLMAQISLK